MGAERERPPRRRTICSQCGPWKGNSGFLAGTSCLGRGGAGSGAVALHGGWGRGVARRRRQGLLLWARSAAGPCPRLAPSWMFTASQDGSSNIPRFPCQLGPGKVGEVHWRVHLHVLQATRSGWELRKSVSSPAAPGLALPDQVSSHRAILQLSSPAEAPL